MSGFACIPHDWSRDPRLGLKAKGLLVYLFSHASGYELTLEQIVAENADGLRSIRTAMAQLIEFGYVERTRDRGRDGKLGVYRYTVVSVVISTVSITAAQPLDAETHTGGDQEERDVSAGRDHSAFSTVDGRPDAETHSGRDLQRQGIAAGRDHGAETQCGCDQAKEVVSAGRDHIAFSTVQNATSKEEQSKKIKKTLPDPLSRLDSDPDFVAFWAAYPRRTDKGHARKAWAAAVGRGTTPKTIIDGATAFRDSPRRSPDPRYVPHPATWLNGDRWLDEDRVVAPRPRSSAWWNN